jgi:hypothetical protein
MSQEPEAIPTDPVALARLFVRGHSIKRGETIQLVRDLLALLDAPGRLDMPAAIWKEETVVSDHLQVVAETPEVRPPIEVRAGTAGSVYLGPDANRYFTQNEALALAGAISRAAAKRGV